jgi:hypothetical protein
MKTCGFFFSLFLWHFAFLIVSGQEKPEAVLIDEFGRITCEEQLARTDNFFAELMNNPDSTGYVVIYQDKEKPSRATYTLKVFKGWISQRRYDKSRIVFIRGETEEKPRVELWRVPPGAEKPAFKGAEWEKSAYALTKPFVFYVLGEDSICPTFVPGDYADLINANPNVFGHLVIFNGSKAERKETSAFWLKSFTGDFKVPRNRLKVFYAKDKSGFNHVEFWIVPRKKK